MDELVELLWDRGTVGVRGQSSHPSNSHNHINFHYNTNNSYNYKKTTGAIPFLFAPFNDTIALSPTPEMNEKKKMMMNKDTGTLPKILRFGSPESMLEPDIFSSSAIPPTHDRDRDHVEERDADADTGTVPWIDYPILDASDRYSEDELPSNLNHNPPLPPLPSKPLDIQASVPVHKSGREDDVPCSNKKPPHLQLQKGGLGLGVINFSNFLRPVVLAKASLQSSERLRSNEKASTSNNNNSLLESMVLESASALQPPAQPSSLPQPQMLLPGGCQKVVDASQNYCDSDNKVVPPSSQQVQRDQLLDKDKEKGKEKEKGAQPVLAPTSVCSRNVDPKHKLKRKIPEEDFAAHSDENFEDESVELTRPSISKGAGTKRGRTAEVHNLSERRRRDRINEKMRALQELIPNCNKVDKASMLDEAIEYLKSLQLQVQMMMMLMGTGMCVPPMMLPPGLHHMPLAPYPQMGMGMGMNMGMGMGIGMGMGYGMGVGDIIHPAVNHTMPTPPLPPSTIPLNFMPMVNGSTFKLDTGIPPAPSFEPRDISSDPDIKANGCHMPSEV